MAEIRYLKASSDGWLTALIEPAKTRVSLPEHLKVEWTSTQDGRDYFIVKEGVNQRLSCSMKEGFVVKQSPRYQLAAELTYDVAKGILTYPGSRKFTAITSELFPIPKGRYPIQLPDAPHDAGRYYVAKTPYAKSWFYLGEGLAVKGEGDRYLHPGTVSAGCVTVKPEVWTELYQYLILCRGSDGKTVGTLTVK